jgi:hypothetical protein
MLALALTSSPAYADTFQERWMGRIARPPADDQEGGSVRPRAYRLHGDPDGAGDVKRPSYTSLENAPS